MNPFVVLESNSIASSNADDTFYKIFECTVLDSTQIGTNSSVENKYILIKYYNCALILLMYDINYASGARTSKTMYKSFFVIKQPVSESILISLNDICFDYPPMSQGGGIIGYYINISIKLKGLNATSSFFEYPDNIQYKILSTSDYLNSIFN